ncbi:MAG: SHOCT domain-containing protein [Abditibacteriota bacterium]|nr:SHOCT domain-containing protein [Abditibacteriota bacterium]
MNDKFEQLQRLAEMKKDGLLTDEEFEKLKAEIFSTISDTDTEKPTDGEYSAGDPELSENTPAYEVDSSVPDSDEPSMRRNSRIFAIILILFLIVIMAIYMNSRDTGYSTDTTYESTTEDSGGFIPYDELKSENESTSSESASEPKEEPKPEKQKKPDLELNDYKAHIDEVGYVYIEGSVTNNTNEDYSFVEIEFNLYDDDNAQVGTALDNTTNLEAGGTWKFKAISLCEGDNVSTYKPVNLHGMKY